MTAVQTTKSTNTTGAKFISLEGSEGAGKSTSLNFITEWFKQQAIDFICTREPGGTPFAEQIRELLLADTKEAVQPKTELMLMYAARMQHVESLIKPNLANGTSVISDRFNDASFAYQGAGRGMPMTDIAELDDWCLKGFKPDLTLFLDLPVALGMERAGKRGKLDRFEQEHISFFEKVREGYLARAKAEPSRIQVIDASLSIPEVEQQIAAVLSRFILEHSE